jgi:hypothetical protein
MYSRESVNRKSTNQRYVTRHPPRWVRILIDRYNRLDHAGITCTADRRITLREFVEWQLCIAGNWRLAALHGLPWEKPTAEMELLHVELERDPLKKLDFFLTRVRICPLPCRQAF